MQAPLGTVSDFIWMLRMRMEMFTVLSSWENLMFLLQRWPLSQGQNWQQQLSQSHGVTCSDKSCVTAMWKHCSGQALKLCRASLYINNEVHRFRTLVVNSTQKIHNSTTLQQWFYMVLCPLQWYTINEIWLPAPKIKSTGFILHLSVCGLLETK